MNPTIFTVDMWIAARRQAVPTSPPNWLYYPYTESVPEKQFGRFNVPGLAHMRPGGTVEVEISGLGVLRNPIIADEPVAYRPGK